MKKNSPLKWFRNISIAHKLYWTVGTMALLIAIELFTLWFSISTLSSVRAFVGGEGLWSKAQKDAIYHLQKYVRSENEADYQNFLYFLKVPLGDRKTRIEMGKENPDYDIMRQGFLEGHNHPEDIDGMIKLFRRFHSISYINKAIIIWTQGDSILLQLQQTADEIHWVINKSRVVADVRLEENIAKIDEFNKKLTVLEDEFSATLGEGSRWLENLILKILLAIALTVEISGLLLTISVSRNISVGINKIISASKQVADGNFNAKAIIDSEDEIGQMADSFNKMTDDLEQNIIHLRKAEAALISKEKYIEENQARVNEIVDAVLRFTSIDFSKKIPVSDKGDELDAIAVGLNTLSEELESHIQQIKEGEEQIQTIFQNAPDGVVVIDEHGVIVRWNPRAEVFFGWKSNEVLGKHLHEVVIPERFREAHLNGLKHFLQTGAGPVLNRPLELPALRKDQTEFDAGISISPTTLKGKYFFIGFVSDITQRKKAEMQIKESEGKFRALLDSAPDSMVIVGRDGKILMVNIQTEKLFGWTKDEMLGKEVELLIPNRFHQIHPQHRTNFFADPKVRGMGVGLELFGQKKNGEEFPVEISLSPLKTNEGIIVSAAIRDITDRKKSEAEIKQKSEELARSNKELEQFAYVASHDLQEPLRIITSYVQLLDKKYKDKLDADANDYINFTVDSAKRMRILINDLLTYSRVTTQPKFFGEIDCNEVLSAVLENLKTSIHETSAKIIFESLPLIHADYSQMLQLFQNLIFNAIKFRAKNKPKIKIAVEDKNSHWQFSVSDNGIGIKKEYLEKIFIIFQRLHSQKEYPGTGIGLSICKKIVEQYGGKIWAESELGKGTIFYFTIRK